MTAPDVNKPPDDCHPMPTDNPLTWPVMFIVIQLEPVSMLIQPTFVKVAQVLNPPFFTF